MQPRPSKGTTSPSWGSEDTQHHRDLPWIQHCELVCPNLFGFTLNTKQDIVITKALEAKKKLRFQENKNYMIGSIETRSE